MLDQPPVLGSSRGEPAPCGLRGRRANAHVRHQIDPKLVLPDWAPPLPFHTDLSFHAIPSLTLVTDLLFFSPPYTIAFLPALALSGCIAFGYWFWIERCYQFNHFYPYPIFGILNATQRAGWVHGARTDFWRTRADHTHSLFGLSALLMTLSTALLVWLYGIVNGKEMKELNDIKDMANGDLTNNMRSGNVKGD